MKLIHFFAPVQNYHLDDLVTQANSTGKKIEVATQVMLPLLETKIEQIAEYYKSLPEMPYWVNKMHTAMLRRRCELLAIEVEQL